MDDLAEVVGSALGVKKPKQWNPPAGAGIVAPHERMADTFNGSPADIAEAQKAIASAPNTPAAQAAAADLRAVIGQGGTQPMGGQDTPFGDIASTVVSALNEAPAQQAKAQPAQPVAQPGEQPGKLASFGAGAGKAVGTGVLALQQLVGKGTEYAGSLTSSDTLKSVGNWLSTDAMQGLRKLEAENAPYAEANPKTNLGGEVTGMVLSPVNKLVPGFGGPAASLTGAVLKGAAQGAILNTLTAPVMDDSKSFLTEKSKQGVVGAVGGSLGGTLGYGLSKTINAGVDALKTAAGKVTSGNVGQASDDIVNKALGAQGIDKSNVTPELFDGLKAQVQDALKAGRKVDPTELIRLTQAQTLPVPVPMLKGQIARDPMQFAKEQNLRGIQGLGEPITETLTAQNKALIANLDALGASKGANVVDAGKAAIESLQSADAKAQQVVKASYDAYRQSTGKALDVPLQGLAQDYAKTLDEFGDAIPAVIKRKFEGLGLLSGKPLKTFTIDDAEALIKSINKNYDPMNKVQAKALNELRGSIQTAIADGAGSSAQGAEAAFLAKSARDAAKLRFAQIEAVPALKDALAGAQPDKFIQKHILQGNQAQIKNLMDVLGTESPQAVEELRNSIMSVIKSRVLNNASAENGVFSQAQLKQFVNDPNTSARLAEVLSPQQMATLKQLNAVAENALFAPAKSAVNTSNTASAAANLIKEEVRGGMTNKVLEVTKRIPVLSSPSQMIQEGVQGKKAAALIDQAVNPSLGTQVGKTSVQDLTGLGARVGASYTGATSQKKRQK